MKKSEIIRVLLEMADLMEVDSANPFRARSYRAAARSLEAATHDFASVVEGGRLLDIRGVGTSIAEDILQIYEHGECRRYRELAERVPRGVREMLRVPGLGPRKARALWKELGIRGVTELEEACRSGRVAAVKGFGPRSQEKILAGIDYRRSVSGQFLIPEAEAAAGAVREYLEMSEAIGRLEVAGSYRRGKEVVKDLDFLASSERPGEVMEHLSAWDGVLDVVARGMTKTSVRLGSGMPVDVRVVSPAEFPFALLYFTGSKEHNAALRGRARARGFKLSEYGLFPQGEEESLPVRGEEDIYEALGLPWIPPELREDLGELELAAEGRLPRLVEEGDIRGLIHVHTKYSDGKATLEEMVEAARARGYSYLGVTDHSQSAFYAGGLKPETVRLQHREIDRLNASFEGFRIFKGIESDIRADGELDYEEDVLGSFDFVIASLHSHLTQPAKEMTARVIRAIENPHTTILGHPTARLLLRRNGVSIDMDEVLLAASEHGVALEINADPHRLELDWRLGPRARELGVLTSIDPDAHSLAGIDVVRYGVRMARKAGFEANRVINTFAAEDFAGFLARRRGKA